MFVLSIIGLLVLLITLTCLAETDNGGWGIVVIIAGLAIVDLWLAKGIVREDMWGYIKDNPGVVIAALVAYITIGVFWSFGKWKMWVGDYAESNPATIKNIQEALAQNKNTYIPLELVVSENKSRIISWMGYWPLSFCWFIINRPITRFYNWLFSKLKQVYQGISEQAYKKITN